MRHDGDQRRREPKRAGSPDHGRHDRAHRGPAKTSEPVLLGAAMLGAVAGKAHADIPEAMQAMSGIGQLTAPTSPRMAGFHKVKRRVYARMRELDRESRAAMGGVEASF